MRRVRVWSWGEPPYSIVVGYRGEGLVRAPVIVGTSARIDYWDRDWTDGRPKRKRILSGVQPSGKLHLGNYFGAIRQHIALQDEGECFYFIADYHALTTLRRRRADAERQDQASPPARILATTSATWPSTTSPSASTRRRPTFYRQSDVPEVTELAWMLATVTSMGLLERAHSYKDKVDKGIERRASGCSRTRC